MARFVNISIAIILIFLALACCAQQAAIPTPTTAPVPSSTPAPTNTPAEPTSIPLATFTPAPSPMPGGLFVNPDLDLGEISPNIYGTNYGPWIALPANMIAEGKNAGMKIIRFPGGAWGDINDIKGYQVEQFMAFCNMLGAAPSISVRLRNGTPEQAAALVKFVNIDRKYGVKYWSIGNEPTLFSNEDKGLYDTPQYNQEWRAIAQAMEAVDPTILLLGPETHQFSADPVKNPKDSAGKDWMTEFLKANGDMVDVVSFHRYPFPYPVNSTTSIADLRKDTRVWTETIRYLRTLIRETTGRDIPVAITEFSTHWNKAVGGDATPDSHYAAIWLGDLLGQFINENVDIANHWLLTSSGDAGSWGLIGRGELRPTYYTYQMYKMFGSSQVSSSSDNPDVDIVAAKNTNGALSVMLINLADVSISLPLKIAGEPSTEPGETWLFDVDHKAELLSGKSLLENGAITLPAQSMTLLIYK